jgi:hypothetical protein
MPEPKRIKKKSNGASEWPTLLLGWIFVVTILFGIVIMILNAKPEKRLVCDTVGRTPSLTRFGTCHRE